MAAAPEIVTRTDQPYVAVRARVTMAELSGLGARFSEVFAWLGAPRAHARRGTVLPVQRH